MESLIINTFGFFICSVVIIFSGSKLSYYGDKISDLTGMGKAWIGLILMASVTSLPELITGISSVVFVKNPDLAVGDILGSCVFNLLIISILDAKMKQSIFSIVKFGHIVSTFFGIILLTLSGVAIYLANETPTVFGISYFSFILFFTYILAIWCIFKYEHLDPVESKQEIIKSSPSNASELKKIIYGYTYHALIVIFFAIFLPYFGEHIAVSSGLSNSFFGTLFMAAATSLPELVVSLTALKMGSVDMAVGNLLGSNIFNILILSIDDFFYRTGSLFKNISKSHLLSIFIIIVIKSVVGLGIIFKTNKKQLKYLSFETSIIVISYLTLIVYLFLTI